MLLQAISNMGKFYFDLQIKLSNVRVILLFVQFFACFGCWHTLK